MSLVCKLVSAVNVISSYFTTNVESFWSQPERTWKVGAELCWSLLTLQCHRQQHPSVLPAMQSHTNTPALLVLGKYWGKSCGRPRPLRHSSWLTCNQMDFKAQCCLSPTGFYGLRLLPHTDSSTHLFCPHSKVLGLVWAFWFNIITDLN